nr:MAG TPA: Cytochrome c oxidase subunit VII [Caudoviricetes sp.]
MKNWIKAFQKNKKSPAWVHGQTNRILIKV